MAKYPSAEQLEARRLWGQQFPTCWLCGGDGGLFGLDIHEICRRSQAPFRWAHPCNYLRACRRCHEDRLANVTVAPYAVQLALKAINDPEEYDLLLFLDVLGRLAVTASEVEIARRAIEMVRTAA